MGCEFRIRGIGEPYVIWLSRRGPKESQQINNTPLTHGSCLDFPGKVDTQLEVYHDPTRCPDAETFPTLQLYSIERA